MSSGPRVGPNLAANGSEQRPSFVGLRRSRRSLLRLATGAGVLTMIATACGGSSEKTVEINDGLVFRPTKMTVKVGESVTWRNTGKGMVHTATCDPTKVVNPNHVARPDGADPWDSGLIQRDKSWIHVFTIAGEYRYCCIPHESAGMIGTIVVIDEA